MRVKRIEAADIATIVDWFKDEAWPYPNTKHIFPQFGYCVVQNEKIMASCHVYYTGTALALVSWIKANPEAHEYEQANALKTLIRHIQKEVKLAKVTVLQCITQDFYLSRLLKEEGFKGRGHHFDMKWLAKDEDPKV